MSSLRNAVPRKIPKERGQPSARKGKHGLLEKHKDYVLRARDYHEKEKRIKLLREKASFRNPDEFYFKMINSETKDGVHQNKKKRKLTHENLKVMKTHDTSYVAMRKVMESKKIEKLQSSLHLLDAPPMNTHTIFVDSDSEVGSFKPEKHFKTAPELVQRTFNRPRLEDLKRMSVPSNAQEKTEKLKIAQYKELGSRIDREDKLKKVLLYNMINKELMGKGKKRKIKATENDEIPQYRWANKRKR